MVPEIAISMGMTMKSPEDQRRDRLAQQLRANLARRKAQARAKRLGDADDRAEGIDTIGKGASEKASPNGSGKSD